MRKKNKLCKGQNPCQGFKLVLKKSNGYADKGMKIQSSGPGSRSCLTISFLENTQVRWDKYPSRCYIFSFSRDVLISNTRT